MALTMTRTRTQTALTKLAQAVAVVHGEMETLERLAEAMPDHQAALAARRRELEVARDALYLTLRQFDSELDGATIGASQEWQRPFGRIGAKTTLRRYVADLLRAQGS